MVNQSELLTLEYWSTDFSITDSDIEQINNHFLEVERPQTVNDIARVIIVHRVNEERNRVEQVLKDRAIYQPAESYQVGDELVFPALRFSHGAVQSVREGYDPRYGRFDVIAVKVNSTTREFASNLPGDHLLNMDDETTFDPMPGVDLEELYDLFQDTVASRIGKGLHSRDEFISLDNDWFVKGLMAEVNVGHLHLAEAVLEMSGGGPLPPEEIIVHLDMDPGLDQEVRLFSLNYALLHDDRFDEVGPPGEIAWFLRRMEPRGVQIVPERLRYTPVEYARSSLSPQLLLLERELDDEWSELEPEQEAQPTILSLTYPHRWAGTLPLSARTRPLFPTGITLRQRVVLVDEHTGEEISAWVVRENRYVFGLKEWYATNKLPVGGFVTLKPGPKAGVVLIDYDRRRPKREWVRLATVVDNQLDFQLERRSVSCGYDDLLIVGTDYVTALEALARRLESDNRSIISLAINIFPKLAKLNPQQTVHSKTIYSAINMIRRVPPGPLFAELINHPDFRPVGDHYWQYNSSRAS
jgi:hypothetical protein